MTGITWSPVYLLSGNTPLLFEAGFLLLGKIYEKDIRKFLPPSKNPAHLCLTHVHWDHCGAASYLRKAFPGLKIWASRKAQEILQRKNALQLISSLNSEQAPSLSKFFNFSSGDFLSTPFEPFPVDCVLEKETRISIDQETTVQVFATSGHTRDMLSYYIPERKILFATESAGCMGRNGVIIPEFLVDYDAYIATINRFMNLDIDVYCQGHHFVFTGNDVKQFLLRSLERTQYLKDRIENLIVREGLSIDEVVTAIKYEDYDANPELKQPERAYLLNLKTQVAHLSKRLRQ